MARPRNKKRLGSNVRVYYGIHTSLFGRYILAVTSGGEVCSLSFVGKGGVKSTLTRMTKDLHTGDILRNQRFTEGFAKKIFVHSRKDTTIPLVLRGTDFEIKVWDALRRVPEGEVTTYSQIARNIKSPKATRAVGTACGKNSIAYLIPCHRALPKGLGMGGYRWGIERKKALLAWEMSRV